MYSNKLFRVSAKAIAAGERLFRNSPDAFLNKVSGVIHVGANSGQERELYANHNLDVVWVEPIPEVYAKLKANLKEFPRQNAYQYLVTDKDDCVYVFNISNNDGASSSIFELNLHRDIWPDVYYEKQIALKSITLASLVKKESIVIEKYDALIMDTQSSEMLVLRGAESLLSNFKFIKLEVPDFDAYRGCCHVEDLNSFLEERGFREVSRHILALRKGGGAYYDIIYRRLVR